MKQLSAILIASALCFQNCSPGFKLNDSRIDSEYSSGYAQLSSITDGKHIKYLGFFASAMEGVGSGDYIDEIKDFANVSWVMGGDLEGKILRARSYNMKVILVVYELFYPVNGVWKLPAVGSVEDAAMKERISQFAQRMRHYAPDILSFYIMDEPYAKGITAADLDRIAKLIKAEFPNHPTSMIAQPNDLKPGFAPASVDWVGFDCYNADCNNRVNYANMKKALNANQRTFMVPVAFVKEKNADQNDVQVAAKASEEYVICRSDLACIGMFPFIWQSYLEGSKPYRGARDVPVVKERYIQIGKLITGRGIVVPPPDAPAVPTPSPTPTTLPTPTVTPTPAPSVTPAPVALEVYRFYSSKKAEHFLTLSYQEGISAGYKSEGTAFKVFAQQYPGTRAIYRCLKTNGKHMASLDPNCEGVKSEGRYGYIYEGPVTGSVELYRFYHSGITNHLVTTSFAEGAAAGYVFEGSMGYVIP